MQARRRLLHCAFGSIPQARMLQALKALLRCSWVWCFAAAWVVACRQKTALSLATVLAANQKFRSGGNPAHSLEEILSYGALVPGGMSQVGTKYPEWAFSIECQYKTTGNRPLTSRSTGRQKRTAFGSLRCAPAPVTSALCGANHAKIAGFERCLITGSQDATHQRKELSP